MTHFRPLGFERSQLAPFTSVTNPTVGLSNIHDLHLREDVFLPASDPILWVNDETRPAPHLQKYFPFLGQSSLNFAVHFGKRRGWGEKVVENNNGYLWDQETMDRHVIDIHLRPMIMAVRGFPKFDLDAYHARGLEIFPIVQATYARLQKNPEQLRSALAMAAQGPITSRQLSVLGEQPLSCEQYKYFLIVTLKYIEELFPGAVDWDFVAANYEGVIPDRIDNYEDCLQDVGFHPQLGSYEVLLQL